MTLVPAHAPAGDLRVTPAPAPRKLPTSITFPRACEREAWRLREQAKLSDRQIGELQGVPRETVNRRINGFLRKMHGLRQLCGGDECELLRQIMAN